MRAAVGGLGAVKAGANYIASLRAAEEAKARGYDQVLWTDAHEHSYLEEVGTMNMVARIGDEIVTPPLGGSILAGVTRDSVITLLREWGLTVNERPLGMEELLRAHRGGSLREIFGCGTAAVITPVGTLGWKGEDISVNGGQPGEIARRLLRRDHRHPVRARARHARLDDRGLSGQAWPICSSACTPCRRSSRRSRRRARPAITVRRAAAAERAAVVEWVRTHGSPGWASECEVAFARQPIGLLRGGRQHRKRRLVGVACYEATCRGFFGPEFVHPDQRGKGVGRALLLSALHAMRAEGHGYAIIGWASSIDFYKRAVGAVVIEGSDPGVYPAKLLR